MTPYARQELVEFTPPTRPTYAGSEQQEVQNAIAKEYTFINARFRSVESRQAETSDDFNEMLKKI